MQLEMPQRQLSGPQRQLSGPQRQLKETSQAAEGPLEADKGPQERLTDGLTRQILCRNSARNNLLHNELIVYLQKRLLFFYNFGLQNSDSIFVELFFFE